MAALKRLTFAVIVPCFNEIEIIETCARRLLELEELHAVVLVDDGSTDGSARACAALAEKFQPRLQAVLLPANLGKNLATHAAVRQTSADVIVIFDADLTVDPVHLPAIIESFSRNLQSFVYGSRFRRAMEQGAMPRLNRWGNRFFAVWVSSLVGRRVSDVLCGVKAMPRESFLKIAPSSCRWGDFDLMFGAADQGLEFREIPLPYYRRPAGASKMKVVSAGLRFLRLCLSRTPRALARRFSPATNSSSKPEQNRHFD